MKQAEVIAKRNGYKRIADINGGVRNYYREIRVPFSWHIHGKGYYII